MKTATTVERILSNTNSQDKSVTEYVPCSETYSPYPKGNDLNSDSFDSVLICNDIDIGKEINKVQGYNDNDMFKLLSMSFYTYREKPKAPQNLLTTRSIKSHRGCGPVHKNDSQANLKSKTKTKINLHQSFYDLDKVKKKTADQAGISKQSSKQEEKLKNKENKKAKVPQIQNFTRKFESPYIPLQYSDRTHLSSSTISSRKVEPLLRYQSSFLEKNERSDRDLSNASRLASSDVRYTSLTRSKDLKDTSTTVLAKKSPKLEKESKKKKQVITENYSLSPRLQGNMGPNRPAIEPQLPLSLREQIFNTFANKTHVDNKSSNLGLCRKNECSTASATSAGGRSSFFGAFESKRTTIDHISYPLAGKESSKKKEETVRRNTKASQVSLNSVTSKTSASSKRIPLKNGSQEPSKKKNNENCQGHTNYAGPYLLFETPDHGQNCAFSILQGIKGYNKEKVSGHSIDNKHKKTKIPEKSKKKDDHSKFYLKREVNTTANEKSRDIDTSSYRDSFLSLRL